MNLDFFVTLAGLMGKAALLLLEYLKVAAWPVVVVVLAFSYRGAIVDVLSRIREASVPGYKLVMTQRLEHEVRDLNEKSVPELEDVEDAPTATDDSASSGAPGDEPSEPTASEKDGGDGVEAEASVPRSPVRAPRGYYRVKLPGFGFTADPERDEGRNYWNMMTAWSRLESTAVQLGERLGLSPGPSRNLGFLGGQLLARKLISHEAVELGASLQDLRNRMVHELDRIMLTDWMALDFTATAGKLTRIYQDILDELDEPTAEVPSV